MPRKQLSYGQLKALRDDILKQQNESAAFYYFFEVRCKKFFDANKHALQVLDDKLAMYVDKYVKKDENLMPVTEISGFLTVFVYETEELKAEYLDALNIFLELPVNVIL